MNPYYEKMREDIARHELSIVRGTSSRDVVAQPYTEEELRQLVDKLSGRPPDPDATFRLSCFIFERKEDMIPEQLRRAAADKVAAYVGERLPQPDVPAVELFLAWGDHRNDHNQVGLALLRHENPEVREAALTYAPRFLRTRDLPTLFAFQKDLEVSEISMGGPLRFVLRDQALSLLERLTGCPTSDGDCFEDKPEGRVSCRSWSRFLNWYEANKKHLKDS